jgi:hypothetical protein
MKTLLKLALIFSLTAFSYGSDKVVEVISGLSIDRSTDSDNTYQEVPDFGEGKFICFWDGKVLNAYLAPALDKFRGDVDQYISHTKKVMERSGAKNVKFARGSRFQNEQGIEVHRFDMSLTVDDQTAKQYYYAIQTTGGFYAIVVGMVNADAYETIGTRADKMLKSAKLLKKQG